MKTAAAVIISFLLFFPARAEIGPVPAGVNADRVNLRISPNLKSEIVGQVSRGDRVEVILTDGDWSAINPPPETAAWISADYVSDSRVAADRLNVRSGPGVAYGRLTRIPKGTEIEILEEKDGWIRIPVPEGTRLWVSARFLTGMTPAPSPPSAVREEKIAPAAPTVSPDSADKAAEEIVIVIAPTPMAAPTAAISYQPIPPHSLRPKSRVGYLRPIPEPFAISGNKYTHELIDSRYGVKPSAFLTSGTIDLERFLHRKVRLWTVTLRRAPGHPDLMEVKGIGFLW